MCIAAHLKPCCLFRYKFSIFRALKPETMNIRISSILLLLAVGIISCKSKPDTDLTKDVIIPKPVSVTASGSAFELTKTSSIIVEGKSDELKRIAQYFADKVKPATGFDLKITEQNDNASGGNIYLSASGKDTALGDEGYDITISEESVKVVANNPAGVFRAIQTLRQLLPAQAESTDVQQGPWYISTGTIRDFPAYALRSSMLDVGRHFFSVDDVKRYIDLISYYKMNAMHLHLSDDQGWRIEIKSWPNLTAHGSTSEVGEGKGGFYTQEQYKDIVRYAQDRFITIIPEVDFPGHTNAALASYPELNCNNKAPELYKGVEVGFSTLCAKKEVTFKFIDDVVRELAEMTPGPYIHLGGDESHATQKDDYIVFANRMQQIVAAHGKQMIGWEEIAQGNLTPGTVIQYWNSAAYAIDAVKKGAKIIMSPATKVYLDMKYDSTTKLGQDWAARIEIDSSYNWMLSNRVKGIPRESILGVEAPLWTETITNIDEIEFMIFPRLPGIAELGWSPEEGRNWDEYKMRLGKHGARMKAMGVDYYKSKQISWSE
jgi:hexosaminidase